MIRYADVVVPVPLRTEFTYRFDDSVMDIKPGIRVMVPFGRRKTRAYVVRVRDRIDVTSFEIKDVIRIIDPKPIFSENDYKLALWMEGFYFSSRGNVLDTMIPGGRRDVSNPAFDTDSAQSRPDVVLSASQEYALRRVMDSDGRMFYLFGITGSGKTEVFLRCAEETIARGGQVIYLVPEITLTHQLARQVTLRFHDNVAILHSALTDAQRITQWRKIKNGEVGLVIGARSAVFAPFDNLKLIIIDEEHENSYKSGNDPRYHARQVAQYRCSQTGAKLLMGSATPSLEAWKLMKDGSKMERLDLTERLGGGALPTVTVADMSKEKGMFSTLLTGMMNSALLAGRQVILFLNRRGFSYSFHCRSCGYELKCPNCDVAMTYHKRRGELVCHYCGHRQKPITVCPQCGSLDVMYSGFGTEQVEAEVKRLFPEYSVARLDTDVVSADKNIISKTLDKFRNNEIQILLGTQMVAKGLNFPNVSLVGIVLADSGLLVPDFRAEERTFDLLVQVSGRSGRADSEGKVVVQTRMKNSSAIEYSCAMDVEGFLDRELAIRKETGFPPFSRMINLVFRSLNRKSALECASEVAEKLRKHEGFEVFGAQECALERVRNQWRFQVLLRSVHPGKMIDSLSSVLREVRIPASVVLETDVDPLDIL